MERDFMGLNSKDSVIVVKEEAVEGCHDSGSAVQWPYSSKISALPHFMSFKVGQEDKTSKMVSNASRFTAMSSADTFSLSNIRQAGDIQKNVNPVRQGGTHFSMPAYAVQQSAHPVHLHQDMKMLHGSNPFFKTPFAGAGQNFAGAPMKHQLLGGVPVTAPHSVLPSIGSFAGTSTEAWFNVKPTQATAQLTIFYGGTVNVYEDISPEKAQAIMFLAGNGTSAPPITAQARAQVQVSTSKVAAGDVIYVNQPMSTQPCSALSSPMSVSSHPVGQSGGGPINIDKPAKSAGGLANPISKVDPPKVANSLGPITTSSMMTSAVPQARKASLARFLEKRKERVMSAAPYSLGKGSAECTVNTGSNRISFSASSGVSSGNECGVAIKGYLLAEDLCS